ncbi:MAG: hypothetical protein HY894_00735 [Deltaproteobacteria bacterium]|nr:hypothetical protein [Deltaproteobacteria bacterium]
MDAGEVKKYYLVSPGESKHQKPRPYYWSLDNGDVWIGVARGIWRQKHAEDVVAGTADAADLTRLDWTKTPFHNNVLTSGWLSRGGDFYGCPEMFHDIVAYIVIGMKVKELEEAGWVRVYNSERYVCEMRLSAEQKNWLSGNGHKIYDCYE